MSLSLPDRDRRRFVFLLAALSLSACSARPRSSGHAGRGDLHSGETPQMRALIRKWAAIHRIPESLLHRVIQRESGYNAAARNGPYYGLMQIRPETARTMGYKGPPSGLLDAETNLHYAGKYLRGAWLLAHGSEDRAVKWYANGYYYEAKRRGMLRETGLKS
ncbi:MAG: lytic transglycosylase domain-containing protein [Cypionkella sp.]|nr:lytic transglycosylase domain-containing protein [Cypionkella sp.]